MKKNPNNLENQEFDVVVVGGGIHGATLALEASLAGYSVALFDKGDFGGATSANSLKIIHGGIRYLQHGDFKRMRESISSRRSMMAFAPHLVKPLACLMPTYGHGLRGRELMRVAFGIYDLVAFDRNKGLKPKNCLPAGGWISAESTQFIINGIEKENLTGGAVWYDAIAHTERLVLEYIKEAVRFGAVVANYTEVVGIKTDERQLQAVAVLDTISGKSIRVKCKTVVNAAGPWLERLRGGAIARKQHWSSAVNLVVKKKLFHRYAVGLEGYTDYQDKDAIIKRGKRLFFFVPWQGEYTMIGTTYKSYYGNVDEYSLEKSDVQAILEDVNKIYPPADLTLEEVTFFHSGLLPASEPVASEHEQSGEEDTVQLEKTSKIISHGDKGDIRGLFSIKGVKYTTAPDIAQKVLKVLIKKKYLQRKSSAGSWDLPRSAQVDWGPVMHSLGDNAANLRAYLQQKYGSWWREVFKYITVDNKGVDAGSLWISEKPPLLKIEVLYFVREELACTLPDVVLRRSTLGAAECPDRKLLEKIAKLMARELDWSTQEIERQVQSVLTIYGPILK